MQHIHRWIQHVTRHGVIGLVILLSFTFTATLTAAPEVLEVNDQYIILKSTNGEIFKLAVGEDTDGDGIENLLEIQGFTINDTTLLPEPWNGDSTVTYFKTDPREWTTDGDPYGDYEEAAGINMAGVPEPEDHPLVASRPVIKVGMTGYEVTVIEEITDSRGGAQSGSYTTSTSETEEEGGEVTASAGYSFPGFEIGGEVSASYSQTWTKTQESSVEKGIDWNTTTTKDPSVAAKLKLNIYMENIGSSTAFNVTPTFNLVIGNKTIATITPQQMALRLSPAGFTTSRYPANPGTIAIPEANAGYEIILTLNELNAIQKGAPLGLVVTQVQADVARWDAEEHTSETDIGWAAFEEKIEPVVVTLKAKIGNDESFNFKVFAGTNSFDPELTFKDVLSLVFDVNQVGNSTYIDGRLYPDDWYVLSNSAQMTENWEELGRPASLMDVKVYPRTDIVLISPGKTPEARVDLAAFGPKGKNVYVSAFPGNFPIVSVKARVKIKGEVQDVDLVADNSAFYTNAEPLELDDFNGHVIVENYAGDITELKIAKPAIFRSADEIKANSSFLPNPGGEYFIALQDDSTKIVTLYCQFYDRVTGDTLESPREYLTLPIHEYESNYVDWRYDGQQGRAHYEKIGIKTEDLRYRIWDHSWATGQRIPAHDQDWIELGFGRVHLKGDFEGSASANVDFTGTPFSFAPDTEFKYGYGQEHTSITIDDSRQIANITATKAPDNPSDSDLFVGLYRKGWTSVRLDYEREPNFETQTFAASGKSVGFGSDGFINMGESPFSSNMTIETWINIRQYVSNEDDLTGYQDFHDILGTERRMLLGVRGDGTIQMRLGASEDTWNTFNTHYKAELSQWVHVAYTFEFDVIERFTIKAYINGNLVQTYRVDGIYELGSSFGYPAGRLIVGAYNDEFYDDRSNVDVDELRIWNKVRSREEIQSTMHDTLGTNYYGIADSGLIGYWRFDELEDLEIPEQEGTIWNPYFTADGADDVRDYSVSGRHGDLGNYGNVSLVESNITSIDIKETDEISTVSGFKLQQNYPNPFNPSTTINFTIAQADHVILTIYNVNGQKMTTLINEQMNAGSYKAQLNARSWPSGLYFYKLNSGRQQIVKRMLLIK